MLRAVLQPSAGNGYPGVSALTGLPSEAHALARHPIPGRELRLPTVWTLMHDSRQFFAWLP